MALVSGLIAFTGFNADGNDSLSFVALAIGRRSSFRTVTLEVVPLAKVRLQRRAHQVRLSALRHQRCRGEPVRLDWPTHRSRERALPLPSEALLNSTRKVPASRSVG